MTDDRTQIESLLRRLYAARAAGRLDELCALFSADATLEIAGASRAKPVSIRARGQTECRSWLTLLLKTFRPNALTTVTQLIDGNRAAVRWRANILSKITGAVVPTELIDLIEFRDGRIVAYFELFSDCSGPMA
jgi:ketosteroid isomerase-like protein